MIHFHIVYYSLALHTLQRNSKFLSTKVGRVTCGSRIPERSGSGVLEACLRTGRKTLSVTFPGLANPLVRLNHVNEGKNEHKQIVRAQSTILVGPEPILTGKWITATEIPV